MDKLSVYRGKTVLITGHDGFKGSWLSLWLKELKARVVGYALRTPPGPNLFETLNLKDRITHIIGDIRNERRLLGVFEEYKPQFVFHLAAQPLVRMSYKRPKFTYETNVLGTINTLEAVRKTKSVKACIIVTSDKCYKNMGRARACKEGDGLGGYDPYSSSKACAELVVDTYRKSFLNHEEFGKTHNTTLSSARGGNIIGGGDWGRDRLFPDCVKALSQNKMINIRNPRATRPWQYVLDLLNGYLLLGAAMYESGDRYDGAWNFGPDNKNVLTVEKLLMVIIKCWGGGRYAIDTAGHPHESRFLKLDTKKARALLNWKPVYDIYESIERTVNWYKNFYNNTGKEKLYELTRKEIRDYMRRMPDKRGSE